MTVSADVSFAKNRLAHDDLVKSGYDVARKRCLGNTKTTNQRSMKYKLASSTTRKVLTKFPDQARETGENACTDARCIRCISHIIPLVFVIATVTAKISSLVAPR